MHQSSDSSRASKAEAELPNESRRSRWSLGTQLLVTVNGICIVFVLLFHVYDYRQAMQRRIDDKRIALREEAITIQSAIPEIEGQGEAALQRYVDRACAQMNDLHSPGHHIVLRLDDKVLQARAHQRQSEDLLEAMALAKDRPDQRGRYQDRNFVVGASEDEKQSVQVLEFVDDLQQQVMWDSLRRFGGSAIMAIAVAIIVDIMLLRIVVRPLNRLVRIVREIRDGNFGGQVNGFRSRELSELSHAVNQMSQSLAASNRQRSAQMAKARRIQQNLLPSVTKLPNAAFAAYYEPADDVAGDFFDVRISSDGGWLVFLADVTGHGIPAAMNATLLKAYLTEACERHTDAHEIMRHINRRFTEQTLSEDFATSILIRRPPASSTLQIVNAGHDSGLLRSADGQIRECRSSGLLLGVDENAEWDVETLNLSHGDRLLVFTDGVTETFCPKHTMFGRDRVLSLLNQTAKASSSATMETIVQTLTAFRGDGSQLDDVTIVLIDFLLQPEDLDRSEPITEIDDRSEGPIRTWFKKAGSGVAKQKGISE